jgi:glycosyltransferase involved in cell wall biosynthesis
MTTASPPTVSVLIPAYRAAGTINRAVDSLLSQTLPPSEILIVDDGSPDDIAPALARYGDRVRLLRKANGGAASTRNHGIDHCTGAFVSFLDADDHWEPTKLERQLDVMSRHPEVGLCASTFFAETPDANARSFHEHIPVGFLDRVLRPTGAEAFRIATRVWTSTVLVRRSVLGTHRFDKGLRTAEDIDLWIKLVLTAPVYFLAEPLATQVMTADSLSRSDVIADYRNMLQVVRRYRDLLGPAGLRWEEADVFRNWAAGCLGEGEMRAAVVPAWNRLIRQPWSLQAWWIFCKAAAWSCTPWGRRRQPTTDRIREARETINQKQRQPVS